MTQNKETSPKEISAQDVENSPQNDLKVKQDGVQQQKKEEKPVIEQVQFSKLFRYASTGDIWLMAIGGFAAFLNGLSMPLFSLIFGEMVDAFGATYTPQKVVDNAIVQSMWFLIIGGASFICSWIQMYAWMKSGERQGIVYRKKYFNAILKQDISWFDKINPNQLATKLATETFAVQGAIGEKVPTFIMTISMLIGGFIIAFIRGWELSLICTAALPFIAISTAIFTYQIQNADAAVAKSYTTAGGLAEQAIHGIKTVKSLNGQEHEQSEYLVGLREAYRISLRFGIYIGIGLGLLWFVMLADYGLGFWFGSIFVGEKTNNAIYDRPYTGGDVVVIFFSIMMGGFSLGQATPCLKNFSLGKQAAFQIFKVIDAKPIISPSLEKGQELQNIQGNITFKDVEFTYPQKPDIQVLKKINLNIKAGQKTALVGESGCGKSTVMQLIERFYDTDKGQVLFEGVDLKDLNLKFIRDHVGYVGQEPVLFATTIRENLKFGSPNATEEEMIEALKQANAYDFVEHLEDKLDTFVGSAGSQLSGGQKQRLSIARAILKNPPILLLDEATSALDRKNEKAIQDTLDFISKNRTTIVVAHRLSTIQNSDCILVIDQGKVVEEGNHETLLKHGGKYAALCQNQLQQQAEDNQGQNQIENIVKNTVKQDDIELNEKKPKLPFEQLQEQKSMQNVKKDEFQALDLNSEEKNTKKEEPKQLTKEEKAELAKKEKALKDGLLKKLYKLNSPEKPYMFIGGIFSFLGGTSFPFISLVMAKMMNILGRVTLMDKDDFREESNEMCLWFLVIALVTFFSMLFQFASWKRVSEGLTLRIRQHAFWKIMNQPVGWFDLPDNNAGTISSRLGSDTQIVNGLTSTVVNLQIANASSFLTGITIGFVFDWRTTLVSLGCFPFLFAAGGIQAQFMQGFSELTDAGYKDSGNLVQESVVNMRTVASFGNEKSILSYFDEKLKKPASLIGPKANKAGILFGFSQFIMFIVYAVLFYVGAIFHRDYDVESVDMFTALFAIMYAAFGAGNNNQFMTDVGAAYNAAKNIFKILEAKDEIQIHNEIVSVDQQIKNPFQGDIEFKNVCFKYPTREKRILNNLSFKIKAGDKVAFVGPSGCGKSTIMQLIMRFYEAESGQIYIDGKEIHQYEIHYLRSQFGVVSQEPMLFTGTIESNIRYNTPNNTIEQIQNAAKQANAHEFIINNDFEVQQSENVLDENTTKKETGSGYQRQVGNKGNQLSGGQKQRIAIARAILKQPKILLLDEATSALDAKNETIVQDSLSHIMQNKTTLCIAHRISTIKDSDNIMVIEDGNLVEQGKYQDLVNKKEYFYRLERGDQH